MTVAARNRSRPAAAPTAAALAVAGTLGSLALLPVFLAADDCSDGPETTQAARDEIPVDALRVYQAVGRRYDIDWAFLASIGAQECNHGRCAGAKAINSSGCGGPMQISMRRGSPCSPGSGPTLWERYRQDGDRDGDRDPFDLADSVATAAVLLRKSKGAPPIGGSTAGYRQAACNYYGACSDATVAYAEQVIARAERYGFRGGHGTPLHAAAGLVSSEAACAAGALGEFQGVPGKVVVAPGANRPGVPLTPRLVRFVALMAGVYGRPIVISTGTNHSQYTTSGSVSDHWAGNGADFGMAANGGADDSPTGDRIAYAALVVAGVPLRRARKMARREVVFSTVRRGLRIQVLWRTYTGGNHHNHVHLGLRPVGGAV